MRRFFEDPGQKVGMKLPQHVVDFVPSRDFEAIEENVSVDTRYKTLVADFEKLASNLRTAKTAKAADYNRAIDEHMNTILLLFHELRVSYAKRAELETYQKAMEAQMTNKARSTPSVQVTAKDVSKMGPSELYKYHARLSDTIRDQYRSASNDFDAWKQRPGSSELIEAMDICADRSRRFTLALKDFETFKETELY